MTDLAAPRLARLIISRPALVIAVVACAVSFVGLVVLYSRGGALFDLAQYRIAAQMAGAEAYASRRGGIPFAYPPTMLVWVQPLALIELWPAYLAWVGVSLAALLAACRPHLDARALALVVFSPAMIHCLYMGQMAAVITALLVYSFTTPHRSRAGIALAIIASIKPQMVLMAPLYLIMVRDWRAFFWAGGALVVLIALSAAIFGFSAWLAWSDAIPQFHRIIVNNNALSVAITPAGAAQYWGLDPVPVLVAGIALGVWLVVRTRASDPLAAAAIVATASLLSSPYALVYDLLPVVPFLVREILRGTIAASFALGLASGPLPLLLTVFCLRRAT